MKKKSILVLSLIIATLILVAGCTPPIPTTGTIEVNSTPAGAKIYLDGVDTGMATPFTFTNKEAGTYVIKLDVFHYEIWEETVTVIANETTYLNPLLTYASTQTITLQPGPEGKDAGVSSAVPESNFGNFDHSFIGGFSSTIIRLYIQFDLSSIPLNARILDADLRLFQYSTWGTDNFAVGLYKVTSDWEESTIDWDPQPTSSADAEVTNNITAGVTTWKYWDIDTLVQGWLDGTITNYGMVLKDTDETLVESYAKFYTSDYTTDTTKRPKLEIDYYIP